MATGPDQNLEKNTKLFYKLTITSYIALLGLLIFWYGIINPPQYILSFILTVVFIGVLLLPARGLYRKDTQVYLWSSYLILIYFSHGIIETWANEVERFYAIGELVLSCIYFASATLCYRESRKK